jgi:hypothetical protein
MARRLHGDEGLGGRTEHPSSLAYPSASSVNGVALRRPRSLSSTTATTCRSAGWRGLTSATRAEPSDLSGAAMVSSLKL